MQQSSDRTPIDAGIALHVLLSLRTGLVSHSLFSATCLDIGKDSTPRFKTNGNYYDSIYAARNDCPDCISGKIKLTGGCTYNYSVVEADVRYSFLVLDYSPLNQES